MSLISEEIRTNSLQRSIKLSLPGALTDTPDSLETIVIHSVFAAFDFVSYPYIPDTLWRVLASVSICIKL